MRTLAQTIVDRASATFTEVDYNDKIAVNAWYNSESWKRWYDHYVATGEEIAIEFEKEGLEQTAKKVREIVEFAIEHHPDKQPPVKPLSRRVEDWLMAEGYPILLFVDPVTGERLTTE